MLNPKVNMLRNQVFLAEEVDTSRCIICGGQHNNRVAISKLGQRAVFCEKHIEEHAMPKQVFVPAYLQPVKARFEVVFGIQ